MGSSASKTERKDDKIRACKERIGLVKQLMGFRQDFATAQLAYLRSLKNIGATLRQLNEDSNTQTHTHSSSSSALLHNTHFDTAFPPPPPPPPPPLSPKPQETTSTSTSKDFHFLHLNVDTDDEDDYEDMPILPPPTIEEWDRWHSTCRVINEADEKRSQKNTEFTSETSIHPKELVTETNGEHDMPEKDSSLMTWYAKQKTKSHMDLWTEKTTLTLAGITKELDEWFLKASACGTGLAVFMDTKSLGILHLDDTKRTMSNSGKLFSALSWSRSSKSLHVSRDAVDPSDPSRPGAHCITLEKLYVEEQKLYKDLKQEESTRMELQRKTSFLLRQQEEDSEWEQLGKTILNVERLRSDVSYLEQSIGGATASILKLIDIELQCQLIILNTGLMHMWNTMYECHQHQYQLSQELSNQNNSPCLDPISDYHCNSTTQLENEVCLWHNTFTELVKSQQEFVRTFCQWLELANWLVDDQNPSDSLPIVFKLCKDWLIALESLPDKAVSEALKGFLASIQSIVLQQVDEQSQRRKSNKVSKRLEKEMHALAEMETRLESGRNSLGEISPLYPKHPISVRRAKVEALQKEADYEKTKCVNLVKLSHDMMLSKLKTSLPSVFHSLMEYSLAFTRSMEALYDHSEPCSPDGLQQVAVVT